MCDTELTRPPLTTRVGVVCHFPPPPGGMPGQAEALVAGLSRRGVAVERIATNLTTGALLKWLDGLRIVRTFVRAPVFMARLLRALPRVDTLHVMSCCGLYFFLFTVPPLVLGRLTARRVILNYRGGEAREFFSRWPRFIPWAVRHADAIVVPSEFLRDVFAEIGFEASIVRNGCHLEEFARRDEPAAPRPTFIVARHLEAIYNVSCVLRAFALIRQRHADARLIVLGSGPEEAALKHQAEALGIATSVEFRGYVPLLQMPGVYRQASYALNGSNIDNTPNAILEAFAAGLPVVSTRAGGIPYLVEHGRTGLLVDLDDHAAMAAQACALIEDPGLAARLVGNARQLVRRHLWATVLGHWMDVYAEPAGRGPVATPRYPPSTAGSAPAMMAAKRSN
jgi:glycosyltransferase involved in cell wall biosynthesis